MPYTTRCIAITAVVALGWTSAVNAATYSFTTINYPGAACTSFEDINNRGAIAGRRWPVLPTFGYGGVLYLNGSLLTFDAAGATSTVIAGINTRGDLVGLYQDASFLAHGFLYARGQFTSVDLPGQPYTFLTDINDAGDIVGLGGPLGFAYSDGVFTPLQISGAEWVEPSGINNSKLVVGSYRNASGFHGFAYDKGEFHPIDVPGNSHSEYGRYSLALGVNNAGTIVGGYFQQNVHRGFLYDRGRFRTIDVPGAIYTIATGINDAGDIVGYYQDGSNPTECRAFIARPGGR